MANDKLLKDIQCKQAKPKEKEYFLNDGLGLRLQIKPNGNKIWQFRYTYNGQRKTTTFQSYPKISLENARIKKSEFLDLLAVQINPIEHKQQEKEILQLEAKSIFSNVLYEWLDAEKANASLSQYEWKKDRFEKNVLPFLKDKKMSDINIKDIREVIRAKNETSPETAARIFTYMKRLFSYAVLEEYCERNIMLEIDRSHLITKTIVKHMPKITNQEIFKELVNSIYNYHGSFSVKNALKVVLHIPLRPENLCKMKWDEIDFDKKLLTISREQMKVKNPNIEDFKMPLSDEVISILRDQKEELILHTNELNYVFVGTDNKNHINKESPNKALQIMDFNDERQGRKIRFHGFRGTTRSMIDTLDKKSQFSFEVKERFLDHHEKNKVVRAYSHGANYQEHLTELTNWWSNYVISLLE